MTFLYSVRVARYDIWKGVEALAKRITRWDARCDMRMHRLMCYVWRTADHIQVGYIGDDPKDLTGHLYCDADFAGCP